MDQGIAIVCNAQVSTTLARQGLLNFIHNPLLKSQDEFLHVVIWRWETDREVFKIQCRDLTFTIAMDVYFIIGLVPLGEVLVTPLPHGRVDM